MINVLGFYPDAAPKALRLPGWFVVVRRAGYCFLWREGGTHPEAGGPIRYCIKTARKKHNESRARGQSR